MFGSSQKSSSFLGGGSDSSNSNSILPTFHEEPACASMCPKLSYQQRLEVFFVVRVFTNNQFTHRLIGFFGCAGLGWVLSLVGTLTLIGGPTPNNIRIFACLYVIGNVIGMFFSNCYSGLVTSLFSQLWPPLAFSLVPSPSALRCGLRPADTPLRSIS